jgi:predicted nuclease of predicted toxin-antitoxin system
MIWLDAQLPPAIAPWIERNFNTPCRAVRDLGLRDAADTEIFAAARLANAIVITKDSDFVDLLNRIGPPPRLIWLTCGNTSNDRLCRIFLETLALALDALESGQPLVEIQ